MEKTQTWFMLVLMFILVLFVGMSMNDGKDSDKDYKVIYTTGEAEKYVTPNEAYVYFSVVTNDLDVLVAREKNDSIWTPLKLKLESLATIETEYYNVYPKTEWNYDLQKSEQKGFDVTHSIKLTVIDMENISKVLTVLTESRIGNINSLSFGLSKSEVEKVKSELWVDAVQNANNKALDVAKALNVKLYKSPKSVTLYEYSVSPSPRYDYAMSESISYKSSDVSLKDQRVSVSLNVGYEYR